MTLYNVVDMLDDTDNKGKEDGIMAHMMTSHTSIDRYSHDDGRQHQQHSRRSTQDTSVDVNQTPVEGIVISFYSSYNHASLLPV